MGDSPLRIVQISDIHLFGGKEKTLLGVNTQESFQAVVDLLQADEKKPDLILLSGDLSQDGSESSYLRLAEILKDFMLPIYYVPGNHDDGKMLSLVYPLGNITHHRHIVLKHWHIILLDSHQPNLVEGFLDHAQLSFLQHCLQMYPENHAIIVFHHPPVPVGCSWLDKIGLTNAATLWDILTHFPKMHTILFGHVHQDIAGQKNGIQYFSAPSTCFQFKKNSKEFSLENLAPGYRLLELYPDGNLKTCVKRLPHYVGEFIVDVKSY